MDELELLKKDWQKKDSDYPTFSYEQIYKFLHKKSSSIVKWIFVICMAEFIFWGAINLFIPESYLEIYEKFNLKSFLKIIQVMHYVVLLIFIFYFYKNYKAISVTDTTSSLMQRIIRTRRTVNYYVYYNIILYVVLSIIVNVIMFSNPDALIAAFELDDLPSEQGRTVSILLVAQIISLVLVIGLLWGYYRIIYGILLRRLNKNYKELADLEN